MAGFWKILVGELMITAGAIIDVATDGTGGNWLIAAGISTVISGVASMIQGDPIRGLSTTTRSSIAPWQVCYGRVSTGGTLAYLHTWGDQDQMLDMVVILAAHPCAGVDELLFDRQRVQIDTSAVPTSAAAGYTITPPAAGSGTSFTPVQQDVSMTQIKRDANGVVTVQLPDDIPYLQAGDQVLIHGVTGDLTLNGTFQVAEIISRTVGVKFTFLSGGTVSQVDNQGQCKTLWADYGRNVYVEYLYGDQTLGQTFTGMTAGTPWQGTGRLCTPASPLNAGGTGAPNPWTNYCSLVGKTAAFIRIRLDNDGANGQSKFFPSGLPQISFVLSGKNDIFDPRTNSTGYSENAALCIADFLSNQTWGFKAAYGSEIPNDALTAAANTCDESVPLVIGGTEPRYACNGYFDLTQKRGEILQNLLTSCAGRLSYQGGQWTIQPASWAGAALNFGGTAPGAVPLAFTGPYKWRPTTSIRDLYNGVKGTYMSPENKWQSTDFPAYSQDYQHGYNGPAQYAGDINLAADNGERRWLELHLPFTISASTAQRLGKIELLRRRHGGTGTFPLSMVGYQFAPLDVISATIPYLNFSGKLLEVAATRLKVEDANGAGVTLGVEIDVQETDSSIYAWSTEEELSPQGYVQSDYPRGAVIPADPWPWSPGYSAPLAGDSVGGDATFGIQPQYGVDAQGLSTITLQIKGTPPINALDSQIANPQFFATGLSTGGTIPAGDYAVALSAYDSGAANAADTDYLTVAHVYVPTNAGSIAIAPNWGSGDDGGELYLAQWNDTGEYVWHWQQTLAPGSTSATVSSFNQATHGGPDPVFQYFEIVPTEVVHGGPWAAQIASLTANSITIAGGGMTLNQWAGRTLTCLAKVDPTAEIPYLNMPVSGSTASSGGFFTLSIGANGAGAHVPDLTTLLAPGDVVLMRHYATFTATSFSDSAIANGIYPDGATGVEAGHVAVVLTGADKGDVQTLASVGLDGNGKHTIFNLAGSWKTTPATGDIVVVCAANAAPSFQSAAVQSPNSSLPGPTVIAAPNVLNLAGQTWLIRVRACDAEGNFAPDSLAPFREVYIFGGQGTRTVAANTTQLLTDGMLLCDTSAGSFSVQLLSIFSVPNMRLLMKKISSDANTATAVPAAGESIEGAPFVVLSSEGDILEIKANG